MTAPCGCNFRVDAEPLADNRTMHLRVLACGASTAASAFKSACQETLKSS